MRGHPTTRALLLLGGASACNALAQAQAQGPATPQQVEIIGTSPLPGLGVDRELLPYGTLVVRRPAIDAAQPTNTTDLLSRRLPGVQVNDEVRRVHADPPPQVCQLRQRRVGVVDPLQRVSGRPVAAGEVFRVRAAAGGDAVRVDARHGRDREPLAERGRRRVAVEPPHRRQHGLDGLLPAVNAADEQHAGFRYVRVDVVRGEQAR